MSQLTRWTLTFLLTAALSGTFGFAQNPKPGNPQSEKPRPFLALQVGHSAPIFRLAFSPDGKSLVTAGEDGNVRIWDAQSGLVKAVPQGHKGWVLALAISPDGRTLATGSFSEEGGKFVGEVRLWDAHTGRLKATVNRPNVMVLACAFTPDGTTLATGVVGPRTEGGEALAFFDEVQLWEIRSSEDAPRLKATVRGQPVVLNEPPGMPSYALAFSPDGKTLATASVDGVPRLWNVQTAQMKAALQGHTTAGVKSLAFSPDGRRLATGGYDGTARLWKTEGGRLTLTLQTRSRWVETLAFSPDGNTLATGGNTTHLWDLQSGQLKATLQGHKSTIYAVVFAPDGQTLATASEDATARLWDAQTGQLKATLEGHKGAVSQVAFSPDGRLLATASRDHTARLWDAQTSQTKALLQGQRNFVQKFAFSADGVTLAAISRDNIVQLWDANSGKLKATLEHPDRPNSIYSVAFSPDGKMVATGGGTDRVKERKGEVYLWDASSGERKATLNGHQAPVFALAFSPDGKALASGGGYGDGAVRLWDAQNRQPEATLEGRSNAIWSLAFSPDGKTLVAGCADRAARLWDAQSGHLKGTFSGHPFLVAAVAFSPDGKTLATGSADGTLRLWDVLSGQAKMTLTGGPSRVAAFSFSADAKVVAVPDYGGFASSGGGQVFLWEVATGKRIPIVPETRLADFSPYLMRTVSTQGAAVSLHDPRDGRVLATLLPIPEMAEETAKARPIEVGAKPIDVGAKAIEVGAKDTLASANEWFITTPEGYFDCSANAAKFIRWNVGGKLYPAERYLRRFRRPDLVRKALRGEKIEAPQMTAEDIPPTAQFVSLKYDGPTQKESVTVTVEASGNRDPKEVILLVNGRPLPPETAKRAQVKAMPTGLQARPIEVGAKPIEIGAKVIEVGAKPIEVGAKPAGSAKQEDASPLLVKRFTFRVPLPLGAENVRLRAVTYDKADLGSNPTEIVLRRPGVKPVPGYLYALCVGVGRYKNGRDKRLGMRDEGFSNLKFPAIDARSMVERIKKEGKPLYERVEVYNGGALVDEQATLANVRAGLKWLQQKVRAGQVDTVVVFLSGHGISDPQGRYYFPTYEFDKKNLQGTSLSGRELQEALGGALRAKSVFLFVDTCHSGALTGARGDDLNFEVMSSGVYLMASSSATQYSYESPKWGHGAFTFALLRSLTKKELARDGVIHFNVLTYAVPEEIAALMKEVGQNETAMQPVVPLEGRRLDEPVAQAGK